MLSHTPEVPSIETAAMQSDLLLGRSDFVIAARAVQDFYRPEEMATRAWNGVTKGFVHHLRAEATRALGKRPHWTDLCYPDWHINLCDTNGLVSYLRLEEAYNTEELLKIRSMGRRTLLVVESVLQIGAATLGQSNN